MQEEAEWELLSLKAEREAMKRRKKEIIALEELAREKYSEGVSLITREACPATPELSSKAP